MLENPTRSPYKVVNKCFQNNVFVRLYNQNLCFSDTKGSELDSADYNGINRIYINGRDNQWLGGTLDVHPDAGVAVSIDMKSVLPNSYTCI